MLSAKDALLGIGGKTEEALPKGITDGETCYRFDGSFGGCHVFNESSNAAR